MSQPKVSIVIPVFKVRDYIRRCIDSVLMQSYHNLEIILVDDCTPDNSFEIAMDIIQHFEIPSGMEIVYLRHEKNRGLSAARNTGTNYCKGDFIFYLDSDDELMPDCISNLMEVVDKHPEVELVQGAVEYVPHRKSFEFDNYQDIEYKDDKEWINRIFYNIKNNFPVTAWNKLIRKDFIINNKLFFKDGLIHEDELWMFKTIEKLGRIGFCHKKTIIHYATPNSIMSTISKDKSAQHMAVIFDEVTKGIKDNFLKIKYDYYLKRFLYWYKDYHHLPAYKALFQRFLKLSIRKGLFKYTLLLLLMRLTLCIGRGKNLLYYLITK